MCVGRKVGALGPLLSGSGAASGGQFQPTQEQQQLADFVAVVLADTEDTWHQLFRLQGETYKEPTLILFTGAVNSACGSASAAVGPIALPAYGAMLQQTGGCWILAI